MIASPLAPGFAAKEQTKEFPIIGGLADGLQCMYMSRGDDPKVRERCLEQIKERVIAIEDEC